MQIVNQPATEILPNGRDAATDADIALARSSSRLFQCRINAVGDKPKLRAARHLERWPWMMSQHEDWRVIRRLVAPPALPAVIGPGAPNRTEHVSSENPGSHAGEAPLRDFVVDARLAIRLSVHLPKYARVKEPLHQLGAMDAERILQILARTGT